MYKLKPIADVCKNIEEQRELTIKRIIRDSERSIKKAERNRSLLADLDAVGIRIDTWYGDNLEHMEVLLGSLNTEKTKKGAENERATFIENFRKVRELVGGPLKVGCKNLHNAKKKLVKVTMENDAFPGVAFTYICKLPAEAKCKIVRRRSYSSYASLVCDV